MKFRTGVIACVAITLLSIFAWLGTGRHFATRWECPVDRCETDQHCYAQGQESDNTGGLTCKEGLCLDAFGDKTPAPERYETCYEFGLTPNYYVDGVLPIAGSFMGLAALLFMLGRRRD